MQKEKDANQADIIENEIKDDNQPTTGEQDNSTLDSDKIEKVTSERGERAQKSALKSMFKQQGMSDEEVQEAIEAWQARKAEEAQQEKQRFEQAEQSAVQAQETLQLANKRLIRAEAMLQASSLSVRPERVEYLIKLSDLSGIEVDAEGNYDEGKVRESLEAVLTDFPELTKKDDERSGFKIGSPDEASSESDIQSIIARGLGNLTN